MKSTGVQRYPAFFKSPNSQVVLRLFANLFREIFLRGFLKSCHFPSMLSHSIAVICTKRRKKGSHVVPSISPNSLTALFSPKLSHFMLHAPKLKKKSSLVPRLFHVPIKAACSQLVPRQRFASRAPAVSSHAASARTSALPVSNQCKYF